MTAPAKPADTVRDLVASSVEVSPQEVATDSTCEGYASVAFVQRVEDEVRRRAAEPTRHWARRSPTDVRTADEISRGDEADILPRVTVAVTSIFGGLGTAIPVGLATHPAAMIPVVGASLALTIGTLDGHWNRISRMSRRYRAHEAIMVDAVEVPAVAAHAFDAVNAAAATLRSLSAPDIAIAYAVEARTEAVDALVALGSLAQVSDDMVWLATTEPYQRLVTLAAKGTVLEHLCKDRLALPHTLDITAMPEGLESAEDVGAYLIAENAAVATSLTKVLPSATD